MIVLLDKGGGLEEAERELGCNEVEQLLTPLTRYRRRWPSRRYAIDNGAFSGFDARAFLSLLDREREARELCRWVAVPDVVGSARRTLEVWEQWVHRRELSGWPLAFVAQPGIEDVPIPWGRLSCLFVGGALVDAGGAVTEQVIRAAQALGRWVHVGRVNTPERFFYYESLGVDSVDGTGLARYTHTRRAIAEVREHPCLFDEANGHSADGPSGRDSALPGPARRRGGCDGGDWSAGIQQHATRCG